MLHLKANDVPLITRGFMPANGLRLQTDGFRTKHLPDSRLSSAAAVSLHADKSTLQQSFERFTKVGTAKSSMLEMHTCKHAGASIPG